MKIHVDDVLVATFRPELADWVVTLTLKETFTLREAERICQKAASALEHKYGPDEETDWAWAAIYLRGCLAESHRAKKGEGNRENV